MFIDDTEIDTLHCLRDVMNGEYVIVPHNHVSVTGMQKDLIVHHEKNMSAPWPTPRHADITPIYLNFTRKIYMI